MPEPRVDPTGHRPGDQDAVGAAVAEYLAGGFGAPQRAAFSGHLLGCEDCWQEVQLVERGRRVVESAREMPPSAVRERVRAGVLAEAEAEVEAVAPYRRAAALRDRLSAPRVLAAAACIVVLLVGAGVALSSSLRSTPEPPALAAAVADFRAQELPGRQMPTVGAPDLSGLRLTPIGAAGGRYDDLAVDGYAYRDPAGRRLVVYLTQEPFPRAPGADPLEGPDGAWTAERDGVTMLCARAPHALLVVGQDAKLVRGAAGELGVL